jgi:hypothetical protein
MFGARVVPAIVRAIKFGNPQPFIILHYGLWTRAAHRGAEEHEVLDLCSLFGFNVLLPHQSVRNLLQLRELILGPFIDFFDIDGLGPDETRDDFDQRLDQSAALLPRMILILRKLARIREAAAHTRSAIRVLRPKIGRNDLCHCGSGKKYKRCCALA